MQEVDRNTREARENAGPLSRECGPSGRCVTGRKLVSMGDVKELSDSQQEASSVEITVTVDGVTTAAPRSPGRWALGCACQGVSRSRLLTWGDSAMGREPRAVYSG